MMGSGKTTVGKTLAEKLGWPFYDTDSLIEAEEKTTIAEIFKTRGEPAFRLLEKNKIMKLASEDACVVATGGGAPCSEENWKNLSRAAFTAWLRVAPETILRRLRENSGDSRPLLKEQEMSLEKIARILK